MTLEFREQGLRLVVWHSARLILPKVLYESHSSPDDPVDSTGKGTIISRVNELSHGHSAERRGEDENNRT